MTFKKIISIGLFTISMSGMSIIAHAGLTIVNNTSLDSTAIINNGICSSSSALGESGITKAKSSNTITDFVLWFACHATPAHCLADVYMSNNCSGPKIATVAFDTHTGIKSIEMHSSEYIFSGGGFSIQLNGGPELADGNNNMMW